MEVSDITLPPQAPADHGEELTQCDREPIHIPGSIQPHGLLLIADPTTLEIVAGAGDIETRLAERWSGVKLPDLLAQDIARVVDGLDMEISVTLEPVQGRGEIFDATLHRGDDWLQVELEPRHDESAPGIASMLALVDQAGRRLEHSHDLRELCETAADLFRDLIGYDRVMIYRFQEDGAGAVLAESREEMLGSFLNHHFPATDIPKQARALYVRNRIRVIPDVGYEPAPIRTERPDLGAVDLSDVGLRSVSPIHVRYLKNMAVGASASISIVKDGHLWGLVACHHSEPKAIPLGVRMACRILSNVLSRQISAKDEAELSRERIRIRTAEDAAFSTYDPETDFDSFIETAGDELRRILSADGLAVLSGPQVHVFGRCPEESELRALADKVKHRGANGPFQTDRLSETIPQTEAIAAEASGLLVMTLSSEVPTCLLWTRAEKLQTVEWAGNPHKGSAADPQAILTPRSSFETWTNTVRGRSRPWTIAEVESAARIGRVMRERRQTTRLRELNRELTKSVQENELLLRQKGFLLREVNHRVQNSLQLVSAFLRMQAREAGEGLVKTNLDEAQRRLNAVALVHRRLYTGESVEVVDLSRYLEELWSDLATSMDPRWSERVRLDLAPVQIAADRAVHVGLLMTELVINAQKYAYGGEAGPLAITLDQNPEAFRLSVADRGAGKGEKRLGFGSRMMAAIVQQVGGQMEEENNRPGLKTILTVPL